jgi:hypothetical protein
MQLVAPDILESVVGLSPGLAVTGLSVGALLWFVGGLTHRFWVVLGGTVIAGVVGLFIGKHFVEQMPPVVLGLLLAVSVGALALALFRVVLFIASGAAVMWLAGTIVPSWDEPIACFLAGGLLGIALYKPCIIALSSFGGTLLMSYSGLLLASSFGKVDVVALAAKQTPMLNWSVGTVTVLGVLVQFLILRRGRGSKKGAEKEEEEEPKPKKKGAEKRSSSLWERVVGERKAG